MNNGWRSLLKLIKEFPSILLENEKGGAEVPARALGLAS